MDIWEGLCFFRWKAGRRGSPFQLPVCKSHTPPPSRNFPAERSSFLYIAFFFSGSRSHPVAHDGRDLPWQAPGRQIARATTFAFADFVPAVGSFDLHAKMSSMQGGMTGGIDRMEI